MDKLKKGDIVGRISYGKDILFEIKNIIKISKEKIYILKGITERIEADSPEEDLEIMDNRVVTDKLRKNENKINNRLKQMIKENDFEKKYKNVFWNLRNKEKKNKNRIYTGKILHLDGDKRYGEKSARYYKSIGLNAIVKNIPENKQVIFIKKLLDRYNPDILIITGHDGMIRKGTEFNNVYNYRNSKYFIQTVREARHWKGIKSKDLAIFAGACQSYYEAIISARS